MRHSRRLLLINNHTSRNCPSTIVRRHQLILPPILPQQLHQHWRPCSSHFTGGGGYEHNWQQQQHHRPPPPLAFPHHHSNVPMMARRQQQADQQQQLGQPVEALRNAVDALLADSLGQGSVNRTSFYLFIILFIYLFIYCHHEAYIEPWKQLSICSPGISRRRKKRGNSSWT
jgi:hypothetical protein